MDFKTIYPEAHFSLYEFTRSGLPSIGFDLFHAVRTRQYWGTYQGYRRSSLIPPDLCQAFYHRVGWDKVEPAKRDVEPIRSNE